MLRFAIALTCLGGAAHADSHGTPAIFMAETCLRSGDAAFEHALRDDVSDTDRAALEAVYTTATFECLGLSMEICEGLDDSAACLVNLSDWVRRTREGVTADLPDGLEVAGYADALALARAGADPANCTEMSEDQRARYCSVVAEGMALEDAYAAWRLARQAGEMELEGHAPVEMERIR